jgi:hypothetical protein
VMQEKRTHKKTAPAVLSPGQFVFFKIE